MKDWTCQGILLEEREEGVYTFECHMARKIEHDLILKRYCAAGECAAFFVIAFQNFLLRFQNIGEVNPVYQIFAGPVAYLSGSANMLETGIRFLDFQNGECCQVKDLQRWYDTPNREQYHFNAFRNWINDPNGIPVSSILAEPDR